MNSTKWYAKAVNGVSANDFYVCEELTICGEQMWTMTKNDYHKQEIGANYKDSQHSPLTMFQHCNGLFKVARIEHSRARLLFHVAGWLFTTSCIPMLLEEIYSSTLISQSCKCCQYANPASNPLSCIWLRLLLPPPTVIYQANHLWETLPPPVWPRNWC